MSKREGDPGFAPGWCIYYRGAHQHDTCEKGVCYDSFQPRSMETQPCFLDDKGQSKCGALLCEHLRRPTFEEIALHEKWIEERLGRLSTCMGAARADAKSKGFKKGHGGASSLPCPMGCGGTLRYSVASYNGHMHGSCTTKGCVSWMQ